MGNQINKYLRRIQIKVGSNHKIIHMGRILQPINMGPLRLSISKISWAPRSRLTLSQEWILGLILVTTALLNWLQQDTTEMALHKMVTILDQDYHRMVSIVNRETMETNHPAKWPLLTALESTTTLVLISSEVVKDLPLKTLGKAWHTLNTIRTCQTT